jgi:hypothetical protein
MSVNTMEWHGFRQYSGKVAPAPQFRKLALAQDPGGCYSSRPAFAAQEKSNEIK